MKFLSTIVLLLATTATAQSVTPNLNLRIQPPSSRNWGLTLNSDLVLVDSAFSSGECGDATHAVGFHVATRQLYCQSIPGTGITLLPIVNGGTGTATPTLIAGSNITISGAWPFQTIDAAGAGSPAFSVITGGTNTSALLMGTGGSLSVTGSGTINATALLSGTWAIPGAIGATTPNSGAFTSLSSTTNGTFNDLTVTGICTGCSGSTTAFASVTAGTNTAALVVGSGGSLAATGTGSITASTFLGLTAGTSGGVPYFSTSSTLASSAALTSGLPIVGGGAGSSPISGTRTGNTTQFATWTGATTGSRCVDTDVNGNLHVTSTDCNVGAVTSVGETFTGGIISVSGSPITSSGTFSLTLAGVSGGVPYFSTGTSWASSAVLTANLPVLGGGVAGAPTSGSRTGNTTQFATWTGATTAGRCVDTDASGNLQITATDCSAGAGNVANSGTPVANQVAIWTDATHIKGITGFTVDSGGNVSATSLTTSGSTAGYLALSGNSTPPSLLANTAGLVGPNGSVGTSYGLQMSVAGPSAAGVMLLSAPSGNMSQISYSNGPLATSLGGTGFNDLTPSGSTHKLASVLGTLSTGASANFDASGNLVAGSVIDNGSQVTTNENLDVVNQGIMIEVPNAGTTGTSIAHLTKLTGAPSTAVIAATTDTSGIIGITEIETAGGTSGVTTGNAGIIRAGQVACAFDGATTSGDYVQISPTIAGDCVDTGSATYPTSGQVIGRVLSTNGSAGTYQIIVVGAEIQATPGTGTAGALTVYGNPSTSSGVPSFTTNPVVNTVSTGTPPACTPGSGGGMCNVEGTAFTNATGASGLYADSTTHEYMAATNGSSSMGMLHRTQPGAINQTSKTAAISTATLCAASAGACNTAGQYHIHWNLWGSGTACSSVTAGSVTFLLTWTDENVVTHSAVALQMMGQTGAATEAMASSFPFQTALANESASGDFTISTNGSVIQYATGYTACTTGTGTYNLRATVTRLQ